MKVLAGIVLYNPQILRLRENINSILPQVDCLVLIENGSKSLDYVESLKDYKNLVFIKNNKSMGIAYALNQICGYAYSLGYEWALTLDQDSVVSSNMIEVYKKEIDSNTGILGCWIDDRNFKEDSTEGIRKGTFEVDWVITSASFTNIDAWKTVGGFDSKMFIDWVDWDICVAMHRAGYKIMQTYKTKLIHELGENTRYEVVLGRKMMVLNRPSFRYYYVFRNRIYMSRKYSGISLRGQLRELKYTTLTVLRYEKHPISNLFAIIRGIVAGFFIKVSYNSINDSFFNDMSKTL